MASKKSGRKGLTEAARANAFEPSTGTEPQQNQGIPQDLTQLKPYGDIWDDGLMQVAFTLPVPPSPEAKEAATLLLQQHGYENVLVAEMSSPAEGFSFFVAFVKSPLSIDFTQINVPKTDIKRMDFEDINEKIRHDLGRKAVILGACTGADAHTVGIDAIMNSKGYHGDWGLERYPMFESHNLGAQVDNDDLISKAVELKADVILISKVITQRNIHIDDLADFMSKLEKAGLRKNILTLTGGPRLSHKIALDLGYDAGFGPGTQPSEVATYIALHLPRD